MTEREAVYMDDHAEDINVCERCEMLEGIIIARNKQISKLLNLNLYREEIYLTALQVYGEETQITMVFEEMAELQKELCKYLRSSSPRNIEIVSHIAEEIADVEIMLEQMKLLFEITDAVERFKIVKVDRLRYRLK